MLRTVICCSHAQFSTVNQCLTCCDNKNLDPVEGTAGKDTAACDCSSDNKEAGNENRSIPCLYRYLGEQVVTLREFRLENLGLFEKYERFGMRIKTLLDRSRDGQVGMNRFREVFAIAHMQLGWPLVSLEMDAFSSFDELSRLYGAVCDAQDRAGEYVRFCDEVLEDLEKWRRRYCSILVASLEAQRLSDAVVRFEDDPRSKNAAWLTQRIEEELNSPNRSPERGGDSDASSIHAKEISRLVQDYSKEFESLGLEPKKQGNWFRNLLRVEADQYDSNAAGMDWFEQLLIKNLDRVEIRKAILEKAREHLKKQAEQTVRDTDRTYYAVGMIFAGDTPGSPFGEFAVASDVQRLAEKLRFSLRPVFEPRSSFRELRVRPPGRQRSRGNRTGGSRGIAPGGQASDPRGGGPQPDVEPLNTDPADQG